LIETRAGFSLLKTVAAFLNCGGGILFVGIDDTGVAIGLKHDCALLGCEKIDTDKWQLEFRNHITGKYKEGMSLNDYIDVDFVMVKGVYIARIHVRIRKRLTFLKQDKTFKLYRRQGNRTTEVLPEKIEEFLENRRGNGVVVKSKALSDGGFSDRPET
jgi:predicted HTH transcriptional regulator